jgi:hypothetical protein
MHQYDGARSETQATAPRVVWDHTAGREWRVSLADCRRVPGSRGTDCLIFDSGTTVRRVWSPPADWRSLSDAELLALAERGPSR